MSDPTDVLGPALKAWIEADTGVMTAFGSKPVKVFDGPIPTNEHLPYIELANVDPDDDLADCYDAAQVEIVIGVWSLTSPPTRTEARRIAKAVRAAVTRTEDTDSPAFSASGQRVVSAQPISTQYLTDPSDGKTVHAVIRMTLSVDPVD